MRKVRVSRLLAAALSLSMLLSLALAGAVPALGADGGKIDVWDFGGEQLDESLYRNLLNADEINSWYPEGTQPGTDGNTLPSFQSATGISFNDGGKPNTHRIRTVNTALTRKDDKDLVGEDGTVYQGYIYSNSGKNPDVYVAIDLVSGDKVTVIVGSNGKESMITFTDPHGQVEDAQNFTNLGGAQTMVFYPKETGTYRFWSATEKLVIARIYREHAADVALSGAVTQPEGMGDYAIAFTNTTNGAVSAAQVENGAYAVTLKAPFTYTVSLLDANGYVVSSQASLTLAADVGSTTFDVTVSAVPTVTVSGKLTGLIDAALASLKLDLTADAIYIPQVTVDGAGYTAVVERGMSNTVTVSGVNDYDLTSPAQVKYDADGEADIVFTPKTTYPVTLVPTGATVQDLSGATFTFTNLNEAGEKGDTRLVPYAQTNLYPYTYTFTDLDSIALRDGVYNVAVTGLTDCVQKLTSNLTVAGAPVTKTIPFAPVASPIALTYKPEITVGPQGCDYATLNDAMAAVRSMDRGEDQRVTISVQPGNYEEMLVVDVPNVTLKNASQSPSLELTDKGVGIAPQAVRITHYYGCGYNYYSMNDQCKYDPELLAVNRENGYESFVNPGDGTDNDSYWNSTVLIKASGFESYGIIYENSFNQYVSAKSLEDVIVPNDECKEDKAAPRGAMTTFGDTTVQGYAYKERAGALSITDNCTNVYFENCKFIGRQDTLYGGDGTFAAFYNCAIQGSTDYIYGPMTAVFAKCDLIFNTGETSEFDMGYITAPRHTASRGFLMYNCNIRSTTPGVDTASQLVSKPGYLGRPWQANTGESVYYKTVINPSYDGQSMILPEGWLDSLSGRSPLCGEYGTVEATPGVDNTAARASWAARFDAPAIADGTAMDPTAWLGGWDAFAGKDMTILAHVYSEGTPATRTLTVDGKAVELGVLTFGGEDYVWVRAAAAALADTGAKFSVTWDNGVQLVPGAEYVPSGAADLTALTADSIYAVPPFSTTVKGANSAIGAIVFTDANGGGYTFYSLADLAAALGFTLG